MPWQSEDAKIIREMIFKENEFMNFRITWLVTLQGLLFAALGFAWKDGKELINVLGGIGFTTSLAAIPTLYYAHHAIFTLYNAWEKHREPNYDGPPIIGHYQKTSIEALLSLVSLWWILPVLFMMSWIFVVIISWIYIPQ